MTILEELLVRLGVDMTAAEQEVDQGADRITQGLDSVSADGMARKIDAGADQATTALDGVGESARDLGTDAEAGAAGVEGALGGIGGMAAGAAVGALFMQGLNTAMDMSATTTSLRNGLGLTEPEAARAGDIAGDVFTAGFSDSIAGAGDALGSVIGAMGDVGDFTNAELAQMTKSAIALGDTFQIDIADGANAAGALIKQGLVADGTEAFDVLTKAAQTLPANMAADIPAVVTEYGTHFKRIGIDAEQAFGMMSQFVQAGGRDIDQAADVLHEFARITSEETPRAAAGFKALGLDADKMLSDIGKGGKPAADALGLTLDALRGVKDPAKQAELGVALFGDMAGEAAGALLAMDPASAAAASGMDQAAGASQRVTDSMAASPGQQFESIMRTLSTTLGELLLPALQFVAELFAQHPALLQIAIPLVLALAVGLGVAAVAQWAMNSAMLAWPGTWIILAIMAVIAVILLIATKTTWFQDLWRAVWGGIKAAAQGVASWFSGTLVPGITGAFNAVGRKAGDMWRTVRGWWNQLMGFLSGIPGRIGRIAGNMWGAIPRAFRGAINGVIGAWNNLSFTIGGGSIMGVDIPSLTLSTPNIPYLAKGGIATGATLAMVGEGPEDEAIIPLSRLEHMINTASAPSVGKVQQQRLLVGFEPGGGDAFIDWLMAVIRIRFGGDVNALGGE
ncbi:phage tail tape measure protein [Streptomyces liliifuscus]|uniref:Phage tail tape measure protein n=1 Tax=Streptomyces liliifuscus TaxID=2797636 RepID=A0A7T7RFS6_9ACTN|nr:phage tail tape measure protein [Streptomyces liliifuscus]QQM45015.1 phage tail tape measure protein [Streptomyces liliifuscus]